MPLVKHRVGEALDLAEVRRLARTMSLARASQFLGVHFDTLARLADRHGITFQRRRHYGWGNGRDHAASIRRAS